MLTLLFCIIAGLPVPWLLVIATIALEFLPVALWIWSGDVK